jgi:hypothetical protein
VASLAGRPYLLVRARVHRAKLEEFRRWNRATHIPRMLAMDGVEQAFFVRPAPLSDASTVLMLFVFHNDTAIQKALNSPEAARLRTGWDEWVPFVRDVSIQIYTTLGARLAPAQRN